MFESLELIINFISKYHKSKNENQVSLFSEDSLSIRTPKLINADRWDKDFCLKYEKELLGLYLSENPLYKHEMDLKELINPKIIKSKFIPLGGIINDIQYRYDKNGNKWALITLDTLQSSYQLYIFNDNFLKYENLIKEDQLIYIIGKDFNQTESDRTSRLIVEKMYLLNDTLKLTIVKHINIQIDYSVVDINILDKIDKVSKNHPGAYTTVLHLITEKGKTQKILSNNLKFSINSQAMLALRELLGNQNVWLSL